MKILSAPRTGSLGAETYYQSPFGVCARRRTVPRDRPSNRKAAARSYFGISSREWGLKLTEAQRGRWKVVSVKFSKLVVMVSTQGVSWLAPCGGAAAGGKIARYAATASAGVFFTCSLNRSIFK